MALSVECPECFQTYTVPEKLAGKKIKCRSCSAPIVVKKPETLTRLPPRTTQTGSSGSQPSSSREKKKRSKPGGGPKLPTFSLSDIDSPTGYLIILMIIFGLWFMNMPTGNDAGAINGLILIVVLVLASRAKYLLRRGEGGLAFGVMMVLILLGIFGFVYKTRLEIEAEKQQAAQTPDNQAPSQTEYKVVTDETLFVMIPDNIVLPVGTTLYLNERGKLMDFTVLEESAPGEQVEVQRNDRPETSLTYNREDIFIGAKDRERLLKENVAAAKAAQEAEEKARESLDLVPIPDDVVRLRDLEEVYVHGWGKWLLVQPRSRKGDRWTVKYLEGPLTGKNGEVDRGRLHVERALLPSLERRQ